MVRKKIVFVLNAVITRCIKRVEEFIDNGYEVDVYAFGRGGTAYVQSDKFCITIIGEHDISMSYLKRSVIIEKSLRHLFRKYRGDDVIYYFFFFDVASIAHIYCKRPFIYEESDMPYTNMGNRTLREFMAMLDRRIIRKSILTVMTSEGFVDYHFGDVRPKNIIVVPNRVNPKLNELEYHGKTIDASHLRFAFVGGFRYDSVLNFATVIAERFPQHEFHAYGNIVQNKEALEHLVRNSSNVFFHGTFKNPEELPKIYEQIDIVLATYDATSINAQNAEPNKLYESIFFQTPLVVSSNTFLAKKVNRLGIGFDINGLDKDEIIDFVNGLTQERIMTKQKSCLQIDKKEAINYNPELFKFLDNKII